MRGKWRQWQHLPGQNETKMKNSGTVSETAAKNTVNKQVPERLVVID